VGVRLVGDLIGQLVVKLPAPFDSGRRLVPDALGRVALIDESGRVLAYVPLNTAYGIARGVSGHGEGFESAMGFGDGEGGGVGFGRYGDGNQTGHGRTWRIP